MARKYKTGIHKASGYKVVCGLTGHPLADTQGKMFEHQYVLYEKIGAGPHSCYHCGDEVVWRSEAWSNRLSADHLDWNKTNNAPENLVPSCLPCNSRRQSPASIANYQAAMLAKAQQKAAAAMAEQALAQAFAQRIKDNPADWRNVADALGMTHQDAKRYIRLSGIIASCLPELEMWTITNSVSHVEPIQVYALSSHQRGEIMRDYLYLVDCGLIKCSALANHFGLHPNTVRYAVKELQGA